MKKILIKLMILVSLGTFLSVYISNVAYSPNDEISPTNTVLAQIENEMELNVTPKSGLPHSIYIPAVEINAIVQEVGITRKGNVAAPKSFSEAGWYKYGPLPGEGGVAIIDGHVDNGFAQPGVFKNLEKIQLGDHIYIDTKESKTLHFIVSNISVYDFNSETDEIFAKSDIPIIALITCTGNWMPDLRTHDKRLVVKAVLLE